jgi:OOP family OmpA-OmpF porin
MTRFITFVIGLILFWALFQFLARPQAPIIEEDIRTRTQAAVADNGYPDVVAGADGRDVTLSGTVASEPEIDAVGSVAKDVFGVRVVENNVTVAAPYSTRFCKDDMHVRLTGEIPDDAVQSAYPEHARDLFRNRTVETDFTIRNGPPEGYAALMKEALTELGQLDEGCITLTGQDLRIEGSIRSQQAADSLMERMTRASDQYGYSVTYSLSLPQLSNEALLCQQEANKRLTPGEKVLFDFDSAELHEEGMQLLDEIVEIAALCPSVGVQVAGHTDSVGDKDYNIALGEKRAEAVVAYLVSKGIDEDRLTAVSLGFSQPIADNATEEGRAKNRRIEFRALEK